MTNEERKHLAALCKAASEDTDGAAADLLSRAAAALSISEPNTVTRDDIDTALGCLDAIASSLESLYALLGPLVTAATAAAGSSAPGAPRTRG